MRLLLVCVLLIPNLCFGWGQNGHRITGTIAESMLTPKAQNRVRMILGNETLAEASTWPDFMRSSDDPFWKKSSPLHYVTVPEGETYHEDHAPPQGDAYLALLRFSEEVTSPTATTDEKARALRFIVHIIGDLHQPLHAGNGKDRGGNDVKVTYFGEPSNLHRVWDTQIIEGQNLSYTEYTQFITRTLNDQKIKASSTTDPVVWITESTVIRDQIYPENDKLYYEYHFKHLDTLNERLLQAGIRIATYLNQLFE
jgi:hypothetical protein